MVLLPVQAVLYSAKDYFYRVANKNHQLSTAKRRCNGLRVLLYIGMLLSGNHYIETLAGRRQHCLCEKNVKMKMFLANVLLIVKDIHTQQSLWHEVEATHSFFKNVPV